MYSMDVFFKMCIYTHPAVSATAFKSLDSSAHHQQNELFCNYLRRKPQIKAYCYFPTFQLLFNLEIVTGSGQDPFLHKQLKSQISVSRTLLWEHAAAEAVTSAVQQVPRAAENVSDIGERGEGEGEGEGGKHLQLQ